MKVHIGSTYFVDGLTSAYVFGVSANFYLLRVNTLDIQIVIGCCLPKYDAIFI